MSTSRSQALAGGATAVATPPGHAGPRDLLERHFGRLLPLPAVLIIGGLIIFPLAFNLYMSLQSWFVSSTTPPKFIGLANFLEIFGSDARFWNATWITVKFTGISVTLASAWKDPRFLAEMKQKDWVEASVKSMEIADPVYSPPVVAVSEVRDELGTVIVSSILGENVKAAADKAYAEIVKIMAKTEGK